ncbi:MAG: hypothetical protein AUG51_01755 [Acidobacteria bacterium 13_1_20CM_3_53_8]|nr:MAG: hypothetical protein AUG51_01755 [Acidobacteria bacterium 13_1_20CM_3_53_8]
MPARSFAMKLWKKILLILLAILLLSQIPFAYRRYRFGKLHAAIVQLNSERIVNRNENGYADYRGVIHVHSNLGGHSTGTLEDIVRAAQANALNFVVMTEHPSDLLDTAAMTLNGTHGGVLFVGGNEVSTSAGDRLLLVPGSETANKASSKGTEDVINEAKASGELSLVAYPQEFRSWSAGGYDGIEVYNLYTNSKQINYFTLFFDGLWSYRSYPDLLFVKFYERPSENLRRWDELNSSGNARLVATAGSDAHANVGIHFGDETGKRFLGIKLDPYERSFQIVRTHVLLQAGQPLVADTLLEALRRGHSYFSFDLFCDATGFSFIASNSSEQKIMGDEIQLGDGVRLEVRAPVASRIVLIRDGAIVQTENSTSHKEFTVNQKGVYRVEVYLNQLQPFVGNNPWIISNPIYVR